MRVSPLFSTICVLAMLCGCKPRTDRIVADPHSTYAACVVDTHYPDDRAELVAALGPYFDLVTAPQARAQHAEGQTMVCSMWGTPGLWTSQVEVTLSALDGQVLSRIHVHHGILYMGRSACMHDALEVLDPEARAFSAKMQKAPAVDR